MEQGDGMAEPPGEDEDVLDLTGCQLHDLSDVDLPVGLRELDLTTNRLSALDSRIGSLSNLRKLSLRQNLLTDDAIHPLAHWPALSGLQELVLRDNKLTKFPLTSIFANLTILDVSFNEISSLNGLSEASTALKELYVSKNEVTRMEELDHLSNLQLLELGSNRIRVMEGLHNLTSLQELWLGRNRIRAVDLCGLDHLVKISIQSNRLTSMLGFQDCVTLEELYLSHNGITKMEGLSTLVNLRILDVSSNKISSIQDIDRLTRLEDLWLNDNQIVSLEGIEIAVAGSCDTLTTVYLERNPCAIDPYRLKSIFPKLLQIDSVCF